MSRFVRPETTVLTISDGDTLVVKKRLNAGENRRLWAGMMRDGDSLRVQPLKTGMSTVVAYLLDWSLKDDDGKLVKITGLGPDALELVLESLDPDDFTEILRAIEAHENAMTAEREAQKKTTAGETKSSAT